MGSVARSGYVHKADIKGKGILCEDDDSPIKLLDQDDSFVIKEHSALKIRFADIIVKSSSNKSEALMTITREKEFLERSQVEDKAMMEERIKIKQEERLVLIKLEEEAISKREFEQGSSITEKELINLIGGSRKARDQSLLKQFRLVLKTNIDDDLLNNLEEGEIF
ncbi:unnamed protein product [Eruca vesicaria subsp. sativa]|uniref:Uncharacterized protein n=1 Tax=Eruca vesicaria subsp. sativa TaxID=29727 RepID=A0ABC8J3W1_ERUVS|nr:unnamed protein product [Eruca vesicaria subsp. sativa]